MVNCFIGSRFESQDTHKLNLVRRLIPEEIHASFITEMLRIITEACSSVYLAEGPTKFYFSSDGKTPESVQFVLLNMRYFASASFGKFLTPDVPITNETADRTQATISTACTSWLSSVGAAVGLLINGLLISSVGTDILIFT